MLKVKCNMCENIYDIPDENTLDEMSWAYDMTYCDKCGYNSYTILPEKKKALITNKIALNNNYDQRLEDMRHTFSLLKDEINELVESYINPWLK